MCIVESLGLGKFLSTVASRVVDRRCVNMLNLGIFFRPVCGDINRSFVTLDECWS